MARWLVEVKSLAGDERLIRDLLAEFAINLTEEGEGRYLESQTFEAPGSPHEVISLHERRLGHCAIRLSQH